MKTENPFDLSKEQQAIIAAHYAYEENWHRIDHRLHNAIRKVKGQPFLNSLFDFKDAVLEGLCGPYELVKEPKGVYQEKNYKLIKDVWVDEKQNEFDDGSSGSVYIQLKEKLFLKLNFEL